MDTFSNTSTKNTDNTAFDPSQPIDSWQLPPNISIESSSDFSSGRKIKYSRDKTQKAIVKIAIIISSFMFIVGAVIVGFIFYNSIASDATNAPQSMLIFGIAIGFILIFDTGFIIYALKSINRSIYIQLSPTELILGKGNNKIDKITHTFPRNPDQTFAIVKDVLNTQNSGGYHYYIALSHDGQEFPCWSARDQYQADNYAQFLNAVIQSQYC